jgi:hypothetical protein
MRPMPTIEELLKNTFRRNKCLIWKSKPLRLNRHHSILRNGKLILVHRLAKSLVCSKAKNNLNNSKVIFRHTCDVPACINPDHILLGTQRDNIRDAVARSRVRHGSLHPCAKLVEKDVLKIRKLVAVGRLQKQKIAEQFGISTGTLTAIIQRRTWNRI